MKKKAKAKTPEPEPVSVRCSPATRQNAKVYAASKGRTIQSVIDAAVDEYIKRGA